MKYLKRFNWWAVFVLLLISMSLTWKAQRQVKVAQAQTRRALANVDTAQAQALKLLGLNKKLLDLNDRCIDRLREAAGELTGTTSTPKAIEL